MEKMSFLKRGLASIIDKLLILIAFIFASLLLLGMYNAPGKLGVYTTLLNLTPDIYAYPTMEVYSPYVLDFQLTTLFVVLNILYYTFFEYAVGASLGKYLFQGFITVDGQKKISGDKVLQRSGIFILMMLIAIACRWLLGTTYWMVIALFFLVNDLPVFLTQNHQSAIDFISSTFLVIKNNKVNANHDV